MDLYNSISRRKACRKYIEEPLDEEQLEEIKTALNTFKPLHPDVPLNYRFASKTKGIFHVKAPHYLIISGQGKEGEEENAGFIGQQLMLWLDSYGLGGVWLGASKDATRERSSSDIIVLAFGKPEGSPHRTISEFKRKNISDITNIPDDECIKAVHLAPSGINIQPWYLKKTGSKLLIYRQLLKPPMSLAYKLTRVDIGIALCHYAVACRHFGKPFNFHLGGKEEAKKGYGYYGYVDIAE
jgi:nitroreductase